MKQIKQLWGFVGISGLGWCLDFAIYIVLTSVCSLSVVLANYISTLPAVSLVFFLATKHTFRANPGGIPLWMKYVMYVLYQIGLVSAVSWLGQYLFFVLYPMSLSDSFAAYLKLLIKIAITPITLILNFFVLRRLAEKL